MSVPWIQISKNLTGRLPSSLETLYIYPCDQKGRHQSSGLYWNSGTTSVIIPELTEMLLAWSGYLKKQPKLRYVFLQMRSDLCWAFRIDWIQVL